MCHTPNFLFLDGFPRGPKRCWPLRHPIGLRFGIFYKTSRTLTDPLNGFGLYGPMARDRHPAIFRILGPPPWVPYYFPIGPLKALLVAYWWPIGDLLVAFSSGVNV